MKTILVAAVLAITSLSVSANNSFSQKKVSSAVIQNFQEEFGNVKDVTWEPAADNMLRATFTKDGETISAFYNPQGEHLAITTNVLPAELPAKVKHALAEKVKEGTISEAIRYNDDDQGAYFIRIVSGNTTTLFRCNEDGQLTEVKF
jgi:hypothetical protein